MTSRPMSELKDQPLHANSSEAITNNVRVEVESQYAPEHSQPFQREWFFHYTVRISNEGDETVQLLTRHWIISDASGQTEEVRGEGVVGEQPVLRPGCAERIRW
jgi:ApaG protein